MSSKHEKEYSCQGTEAPKIHPQAFVITITNFNVTWKYKFSSNAAGLGFWSRKFLILEHLFIENILISEEL